MRQILSWLYRRVTCAVLGHALETGRFFHPSSSSMQSGYVCDRCGKTQLLLYRWQQRPESTAETGDESGTDE